MKCGFLEVINWGVERIESCGQGGNKRDQPRLLSLVRWTAQRLCQHHKLSALLNEGLEKLICPDHMIEPLPSKHCSKFENYTSETTCIV